MQVSRFFPYMLIFSVAAAAMEIDVSLPSFPDIARAFGVSEGVVAQTISVNFLGFCLSSLFYGALADRFGRRPLMLIGNGIFLVGSLGCALAGSIEMILACRLIQGLGAAASFVIAFTMLSDVYQGSEATKWIGLMNAIITSVLAVAPILGGFLNAYFGWQSCYVFIAMCSALTFGMMTCCLPETRPGQEIRLLDVARDYLKLLSSSRFLQSSLVPTLMCAGYMAFVTVVPFLYQNQLGMSLTTFSFHQTAIIGSFSIFSYKANQISSFFGERRSAVVSLVLTFLAAGGFLFLSLIQPTPAAWQVTPIMCLFAAAGAVSFAVVFAASLGVFPEKNGPASSLIMSMRTLVCACTIQMAGALYNKTALPLAMLVVTCCLFSLILGVSFYRSQPVTRTASS